MKINLSSPYISDISYTCTALYFLLLWGGLLCPSCTEARSDRGRTAAELENPYNWESYTGSEASPGQNDAAKNKPVDSPSPISTQTPQEKEDQFYQRYFRKGKADKKPKTGLEPKGTTLPASHSPLTTDDIYVIPTPAPEVYQVSREIDKLIFELGTEHHRRVAAVERLTIIGSPAAIPALRQALRHKYKFTRLGALSALGHIQDKEVIPDIQQMLKDCEPEVRIEAVKTLGKMRHQPSANTISRLISDTDPRVRREAILALGRIGGKTASQSLVQALNNKYPLVRREAVQELGFFEETAVVHALLKATRDQDLDTVIFAIHSLGEIGDPAARLRLEKLAHNRNRHIRKKAAKALKELR
ncbi:HEAT repeat domain-containing protein [bacterium]|nr:HEAT repeat domain-containing protein [bacterium]